MAPPSADLGPILRRALMIALVLGIAVRGVMLALPPIVTPDSGGRYEVLARNLAAGHGLSGDTAPPYRPDPANQPGYPLFLAARCWPRRCSRPRAWHGWAPCGRLDGKAWLWSGVGSGACLLVRPDLVPSGRPVGGRRTVFTWRRVGARGLVGFGIGALAAAVLLAGWAVRNYQAHGRLQPRGGYVAQLDDAYARWLGTWMDDLRYMAPYWWYVGQPGYPSTYPEAKVVDVEERARANAILAAGRGAFDRPETRREFAELTAKARNERPVRTFVVVPLRRLVRLWLNVASYVPRPAVRTLSTAVWGQVLLTALVGIVAGARRQPDATLLLAALVVGRSVLPLSLGSPASLATSWRLCRPCSS